MFTADQHAALHLRRVQMAKSDKLACGRCGGSGIYHTYGTCFRCGGNGIDPAQPKHLDKSKKMAQQRAWAAMFRDDGKPVDPVMREMCNL